VGTCETAGLGACVESGGSVDEEDHRQGSEPEQDDHPSQRPPPRAQRGHGEGSGEQRDRDQQEGVRLPGGPRRDSWGRDDRRQASVAGLADLDASVLGELGSDQAGGRCDGGGANRPLRGEHGTGCGRGSNRRRERAAQRLLGAGEGAKEQCPGGAHDPPQPPCPASAQGAELGQPARERRLDPHEQPVGRAIKLI
jgi:hypothetical protein